MYLLYTTEPTSFIVHPIVRHVNMIVMEMESGFIYWNVRYVDSVLEVRDGGMWHAIGAWVEMEEDDTGVLHRCM